MARPSRFSPEVRDRAVPMVLEHQDKHESQCDVRGDLARLRLRGVRDRRVLAADRGVAGVEFAPARLGTRMRLEQALYERAARREAVPLVHPRDRLGQYLSIRVHGAVGRGRHQALGGQHRRFLRQRAGGDCDRLVQDRGDLSSWTMEGARGRRVRDARVGRVVQRAVACSNLSGYVLPAEFEQALSMTVRRRQPPWWFSHNELSGKPGAVHRPASSMSFDTSGT